MAEHPAIPALLSPGFLCLHSSNALSTQKAYPPDGRNVTWMCHQATWACPGWATQKLCYPGRDVASLSLAVLMGGGGEHQGRHQAEGGFRATLKGKGGCGPWLGSSPALQPTALPPPTEL